MSDDEFHPPIREVVVFRPEHFPLYRWDNSGAHSPVNNFARRSWQKQAAGDPRLDDLPRLPFRDEDHPTHPLSASMTSVSSSCTSNAEDMIPRCPPRSQSPTPEDKKSRGRHSLPATTKGAKMVNGRPSFLADTPAYPPPCRKPPSRSNGYKECQLNNKKKVLDLHQIPLKPIEFDDKDGSVKEGIAQVLQEVVMKPCDKMKEEHCVSVVFAIRRAGCGTCREHGMQLSELVAKQQANVKLSGVIKQTGVDDKALREFYTNYFSFPLYLDEGWDLYHTIGNKKLTLWKLCAKAPALELHYKKKGIRNIPFGGDLFTQGGILIFDKEGKLRYVYYESYGKRLDMQAIQWAIDQVKSDQTKQQQQQLD